MNFNLSKVEFSRKDIRIGTKIPNKLTIELAYFIGVHVGDGTLVFNKRNNDYYISYAGHLIDEYEFHQNIIAPLIKKLFNKSVKISKDERKNKSSVRTYFRSKAIFTFLSKIIGLSVGKKNNSGVPNLIKQATNQIKRNFLKGLADTDFTLTFKTKYRNRHYYPVIGLDSASELLVKEVNDLLIELGLKTYFLKSGLHYYGKKGEYSKGSDIDINGKDNLNLWMKKIGFNSEKHLTKYQIWKKFGFCPIRTTLKERRAILNGELDINSFYSKHL